MDTGQADQLHRVIRNRMSEEPSALSLSSSREGAPHGSVKELNTGIITQLAARRNRSVSQVVFQFGVL
jgi:hypothetical protein